MEPRRRAWPLSALLNPQERYIHMPDEDDVEAQLSDTQLFSIPKPRVALLERASKDSQTPPPVDFPSIDLPPGNTSAAEQQANRRLESKAGFVAGRCSSLRTELMRIAERCGHVSTRQDISSMAEELALSSTTLWKVQHAMMADRRQYSPAFNEDLGQIIHELEYCCDEITECCVEMLDSDDPTKTVPWFFKKGRVNKLTKHLVALKATLTTMRFVLWIGKDAAKGTTGHVLNDERCIIEAALARNSDAILGLETFVTAKDLAKMPHTAGHEGDDHSDDQRATSSKLSIVTRNPFAITGPSATSSISQPHVHFGSLPKTEPDSGQLTRRFTKRQPLRIHESMASMEATQMSTHLMKKWIRGPAKEGTEKGAGTDTEKSSKLLSEPGLPTFSTGPRSSADFFGDESKESISRHAKAVHFVPEHEKGHNAWTLSSIGSTLKRGMQALSLKKKDTATDESVQKELEANLKDDGDTICVCGMAYKDHGKRPESPQPTTFIGHLERFLGIHSRELTDADYRWDTEGGQQSGC